MPNLMVLGHASRVNHSHAGAESSAKFFFGGFKSSPNAAQISRH